MPAKRKPATSKVTMIDPYIRVKNVARSVDWYKRMLGMQIEMAVPDKKNPAMVRMNAGNPDGVALMIGDGSDIHPILVDGKGAHSSFRLA